MFPRIRLSTRPCQRFMVGDATSPVPLVQLGLHLQYPHVRCAGIHRRPPGIAVLPLGSCCPPSPCGRLSRPRTTTRATPHPDAISRRRAFPSPTWHVSGRVTPGGSHVHLGPFDGVGAQLCPWGLAMGTPQSFPMASWSSTPQRLRSRPTLGRAPLPGPYPPGLSRSRVERLYDVRFAHLSISLAGHELSGGTRASRRCQGRLPPFPAPPGRATLSFGPPAATGSQRDRFIPARYKAPRGAHGDTEATENARRG